MIPIDDRTWQLPSHERVVLGPVRAKHALVIPVINEGQRIRSQLEQMARLGLPADIVIADGGSTDGSVEVDSLRAAGVRALLTKTGPGRLSAQLRMAYAWCLREGYEGIITVDGNGKDGVEAIPHFVDKLREGYDYVQGSRYRPGGVAENTPLERTIGNRLIHAPILSVAGRRRLTDTTNGFRAYSRRYLLDPRVAPFRDIFSDYELLFYLTSRAGQLGYRVCEIPVIRRYPPKGATPTKIRGAVAKAAIIRQLLTVAVGRYHPSRAIPRANPLRSPLMPCRSKRQADQL